MKKNRKRPTRKSGKRPGKKIALLTVILFMMPVLYGLYLCTPCLQAAISVVSTPLAQAQAHYNDLEIPHMADADLPQQIIRHAGYTVSYNEVLRLPNWVAHELTREEIRGTEKRSNRFIADPQVTGTMAANADYLRSGYDKGHMAPAADMKWSQEAMKQSFYFSNICPQHPELNRRKWKDLEEKVRNWGIADSAIVIICGPVTESHLATIGKNRVTVPQRFFKVILSPYVTSPRAIGFLFANESSTAPLRTYAVTVDSVERVTGMNFFSALPDEQESTIEAEIALSAWGL